MTKVNRTRSQFLEPYSSMCSTFIWLWKGERVLHTVGITVHELCLKGSLGPGQFEWTITAMTQECVLLFVVFPLNISLHLKKSLSTLSIEL